jgi:beta-phosphoglucomutase family hydrolase
MTTQTGTPLAWAAIFDWDGVVIDSSRQHEKSWELLAAEEGRTLAPDDFMRGFGRKSEQIIREMLGWTNDPQEARRLAVRKETLYREIVRAGGIAPLPGVAEWLARLRAASVPCAIASSTHLANIRCVLEVIRLEKFFRAIVSAEDVTRGKPDPEVFLAAARKIDLSADRCVVFEDAHVGIEAARAAGMKVIAVTTTHPAEELQDADRVVRRLDELNVEELSRWV